MKDLKDICVDLKLAKRLKEKGFPQDGLFSYFSYEECDPYNYEHDAYNRKEYIAINKKRKTDVFLCSALIAEEILKELPESVGQIYKNSGLEKNGNLIDLSSFSEIIICMSEISEKKYSISYGTDIRIEDKKLCNAPAKMYIYLVDNNLLK